MGEATIVFSFLQKALFFAVTLRPFDGRTRGTLLTHELRREISSVRILKTARALPLTRRSNAPASRVVIRGESGMSQVDRVLE